ncbi:MAG: hypothetical protein ACHQUA_00645, partial [Microgenomates group bacterium]
GENELAISTIEKTIELKPNYKEARLAYALLLMDKNEKVRAREQLEYILTKIDPSDPTVKQALEELK